MSYKLGMTDREVARAAMKLIRDYALLIGDISDSSRVYNLIEAVDCDNEGKRKEDRL